MTRDEILKEAQAFFFEGMLRGYADKSIEPSSVPGKPGFEQNVYQKNDWLLVDEWGANPETHRSFGTTTIWYNNAIAWMMQFYGRYEKDAIPFLKKALNHAYQMKLWNGGRGPLEYREKDWQYSCVLVLSGFEEFEGQEWIHDMSRKDNNRGFHHFVGRSLI